MLDNFEQVTSAAWVTTELLDECPQMKLLVTSREPLHVRHRARLSRCRRSACRRRPATASRPRSVEAIESIQLFVDRARAVRPDFTVTDDNAAAVVEICRRLDGLPLAIELAAARLRLFSPEALRDRLGSRLELLRSTTRDVPERQQTLRATIDWSYALLEPAEQRVFERLAVFADADVRAIEAVAAARRAAEAVGDASTDDGAVDVIESLASLIEKSLVRQVDVAQGEPRVRMLETIREYATEQLDRSDPRRPPSVAPTPPTTPTWPPRCTDDLSGGDRDRAMAVMTTEVGNFRIAWRYWVAQSDLGELRKLAGSLLILNEARGWYHDTVELATDMLAVLTRTASDARARRQGDRAPADARPRAHGDAGVHARGRRRVHAALDLFERDQASGQHYSVLRSLANLYMLRSEFDKAAEIGERILALAAAEDDPDM